MRLLAVALAALATTSAPAKPVTRLFVTALDTRAGVRAETDVDLTLAAPTTSVVVEVPAGYAIDLDARPGTVIGSTRSSTLIAAGPGLWKAAGLTVAVTRTDDGGYRLECSLAQPARDVDLDIQRGLTNPPGGIVVWRAFAGRSEARSIVAFPQSLTLKATTGGRDLRASGRLLWAGRPRAGVNVHIAVATRDDYADAREIGVAATDKTGRYRLTAAASLHPQLLLIAYVNFYDGLCPDSGCASETIAPPPAHVIAIPAR